MIGVGFGSSPLELLLTNAVLEGRVSTRAFGFVAAFVSGQASDLLGSTTVNVDTQIGTDGDFLAQEWNLTAFSAADTIDTSPDLLCLLTLQGSGIQLMSAPVHVLNMFGSYATTRVPSRIPYPLLIEQNQVLTTQLQNLTGDDFQRVDVAYWGVKIKYLENWTRETVFGRARFQGMGPA